MANIQEYPDTTRECFFCGKQVKSLPETVVTDGSKAIVKELVRAKDEKPEEAKVRNICRDCHPDLENN